MLDAPMLEGAQRQISMDDVTEQAARDFLTCLYSTTLPEEVQKSLERTIGVLELADKYSVLPLLAVCESVLSPVTLKTAPRLLTLAERHNLTKLKITTLSLLAEHLPEFALLPEFAMLPKKLIVEIVKLAHAAPEKPEGKKRRRAS
mmetsp:Transcript_90229/g.280255  ORF Transcript_90229/g.280255 Transcript_90229/m.280255 type:complete len:146 (-) Transcript_90229:24-461(-)